MTWVLLTPWWPCSFENASEIRGNWIRPVILKDADLASARLRVETARTERFLDWLKIEPGESRPSWEEYQTAR